MQSFGLKTLLKFSPRVPNGLVVALRLLFGHVCWKVFTAPLGILLSSECRSVLRLEQRQDLPQRPRGNSGKCLKRLSSVTDELTKGLHVMTLADEASGVEVPVLAHTSELVRHSLSRHWQVLVLFSTSLRDFEA